MMKSSISHYPKNWKIKKISDVAFFQEGPGVRKTQYTTSGVKLLNVGNINNNSINLDTTDRYISTEEANGKYNHFLADAGDLVIACSGIQVSYFHEKIAFLEEKHLPLCMNTSTMRFKTLNPEVLDIKYLYYFFQTNHFSKQLQKLITGSAQLNFGPSHIRKIDIIIPPLLTQHKIVEILDHAQALIDKQKAEIEEYDNLIQSIFYQMFGDPITNERKWSSYELSKVVDNKIVNVKSSFNGPISYFDISSIDNSKNIFTGFTNYTNYQEAPSRAKRIINRNDILISTVRPNLKNIAMFNLHTDNIPVASTGFSVLRVNAKIDPYYLFYAVLAESFTEKLLSLVKGANYPAVSDKDIKNISISLPPIYLQRKFTEKTLLINSIKERENIALSQKQHLFGSLMDKAFKGELVK